MTAFTTWLENAEIAVIAGVILLLMLLAAFAGHQLRLYQERLRSRRDQTPAGTEGQEGYITSAVLGLLALLMGFTFALAVDRFDTRRGLVLAEANAIGTTYLRAQLLPEPHRARMSDLLKTYTSHRIAFATAPPAQAQAMVAANDALVTDIWTATVAAFPTIKGLDFSSAYLDSVNSVIDLDEMRKSSRQAKVPAIVFVVLFVYIIATSGSLGYTVTGARGLAAAGLLLLLILMSLMLTIDIDRPTGGSVLESQAPMLRLQASMATTPPATYDRWIDKPTP